MVNFLTGTPITRIPIMAKQPLDLYRLFKLVVERGGLVEVRPNYPLSFPSKTGCSQKMSIVAAKLIA